MMKIQLPGAKSLLMAVLLLGSTPGKADQIDDQKQHIELLAGVANSDRSNLGNLVNALSGGAMRLLTLGDKAAVLDGALDAKRMLASEATAASEVEGTPDTKNALVNNPNEPEDFISRLAGSAQSGESVAWCGNSAIVGFNDSGSFVRTLFPPLPSPSGSISFLGWSVSTDAGERFTDKGVLLPDPLPPGTQRLDLLGDPVAGCTDAMTFYFSSLATRITTGPPFSAISVSKSIDGGQSFGGAKIAVEKPAVLHMLDKPWMDVRQGLWGPDAIYVTYTDFDSQGTLACRPRTAIEFVRSMDAGATWSAPMVIEEVCGSSFVQGSHVAVGLGSDVFVAWESYPNAFSPGRHIKLRKSADGGASFGPAVTVTDVTAVGSGLYVQGYFRDFFDLQGLAVDRSFRQETRGNVYITWQDGRYLSQPDPFGSSCSPPGPRYCFGDILFTRSSNGGATWSAPVRVNDDPVTLKVDQMFPAAAVDNNGQVFVVFYDRRWDPRNFLVDTFVANSQDAGRSWQNRRLTPNNFAAIHDEDVAVTSVYMGDYLGIANDATGHYNGVIVSWGDNSLGDANVAKAKIQGNEDQQGDHQQGNN